MAMMYEFLKKIPLFADLPMEDLNQLCEGVEEIELAAGEVLFPEGSQGDRAYVVREGQIEIIKSSGGQEVFLALRQAGEFFGEMSLLDSAPRMATARARTPVSLVAIPREQFDYLIATSPSAARAMLHTVMSRLRSSSILLRQSEKMAQIGEMTAGIAHELNNPASAVQRGAEQLQDCLTRLQHSLAELYQADLTGPQRKWLRENEQMVQAAIDNPLDLDPLERDDREAVVETWLDSRGVDGAWKYAQTLVSLGLEVDDLDHIATLFPGGRFAAVMEWLDAAYNIYSLLQEIDQGASRMSEVVQALKKYIYLDQAPVQTVDIHEGLNNTLVLLRSKIKAGVNIRKQYDPALPKIQGSGSELNQVWTNLIDNALDVLDGKGEITLRTWSEPGWVFVEIEDNGPGIPEEIQERIFDLFYTTKPPGSGTGLGLNISYKIVNKHGGNIKVRSRPGQTVFKVRLPINYQAGETIPMYDEGEEFTDQALKELLESTQTIAVVGAVDDEDHPAHTVPAYLQAQGYTILPVDPDSKTLLGVKTYPDLQSINRPVDLVLVLRLDEPAARLVEGAARTGARTLWLQEWVAEESLVRQAHEAGLQVVMDTCIRTQHERLVLPTRAGDTGDDATSPAGGSGNSVENTPPP